MTTNIVDISQVNIEELIRDMGEKEAMRLLKQVIKDNIMILKLQNQLLELQEVEKKKRREKRMKEKRI